MASTSNEDPYESESESDPYNTDETDDYIPDSDSPISSDDSGQLDSNEENQAGHVTPNKTRKRKKNISMWKRNEKKRLRTEGKVYEGHRGQIRQSKQLIPFNHACRYKCNNISEADRQALFDKFYKIPSYDLQTAYLSSCIKKEEVARRHPGAHRDRRFSSKIMLGNERVCKAFFLKTFDISNRRFTVVCAKTDKFGICETDKRGRMPSVNKIDAHSRNLVIRHIEMFPKYKSHYSRKDNMHTRYLSPDLNVTRMYSLYKQYCNENNKSIVKLSYYRNIFNTEFNLRFHKPHSDTCSKCDSLNNIIKHTDNENNVQAAKVSLELHQKKAAKACDLKKADVENNMGLDDTIVMCFDLQQTLPTPLLTTSKVFYLRQLWTYNFCIHNLLNGEARMYTWDETVSGRGSQEIGSCLVQFFRSLSPNITKVIAYSDSCGGQNKNKNICKLFMFLVKATHIKEIHHKFLEPGHTYMECDRDFGIIEKNKRKNPQVFVPSHWREVIAGSSKKFIVHNMTKEMFYSFEKLSKLVKDHKKDTEGRPIKFKEIAYFKYDKGFESFSFEFKPVLDASYTFLKCLCGSHSTGRPTYSLDNILTQLHMTTVPIKSEKWKNLQSLLEYIPPVYHPFFKNMRHEVTKNKKIQKKEPVKQNKPGPSAVREDSGGTDNEDGSTDGDDLISDYE